MSGTFQLYIRFPYLSREHLCQSLRGLPLLDISMAEYFQTLCAEIALRGRERRWQKKILKEIHIGGSSVWIYYPGLMGKLLEAIHRHFGFKGSEQIHIRLDPAHVTRANLARVNFGTTQSLTLRSLCFDSKFHSAQACCAGHGTVLNEVASHFGGDFSLEHYWGFKNQSSSEFAEETKLLAFSGSERIRLRELPVGFPRRSKNVAELSRKQRVLKDALGCIGYSKQAPELYALNRGNSSESSYTSVLGIGAGSFTRWLSQGGEAFRYVNATSARLHGQRILSLGRSEFFREELSYIDQYHEWLSVNLRTRGILPLDQILHRFGVRLDQTHPGVFHVLSDLDFGAVRDVHGVQEFRLSDLGQCNIERIVEMLSVNREEQDVHSLSQAEGNKSRHLVATKVLPSKLRPSGGGWSAETAARGAQAILGFSGSVAVAGHRGSK